MKITRRQLNQLLKEERQAQKFIALVNENAGKAAGDAIGALMKDERFRALIIQLLTQAATDWIPSWLKSRQEKKELEAKQAQAGTQVAEEPPVDEDGDGIPDEDEYDAMEDEITQVIDRRAAANESKAVVSSSRLRRIIKEEITAINEKIGIGDEALRGSDVLQATDKFIEIYMPIIEKALRSIIERIVAIIAGSDDFGKAAQQRFVEESIQTLTRYILESNYGPEDVKALVRLAQDEVAIEKIIREIELSMTSDSVTGEPIIDDMAGDRIRLIIKNTLDKNVKGTKLQTDLGL
jgi:hypothetical protein